jgi:hypothetical protein
LPARLRRRDDELRRSLPIRREACATDALLDRQLLLERKLARLHDITLALRVDQDKHAGWKTANAHNTNPKQSKQTTRIHKLTREKKTEKRKKKKKTPTNSQKKKEKARSKGVP